MERRRVPTRPLSFAEHGGYLSQSRQRNLAKSGRLLTLEFRVKEENTNDLLRPLCYCSVRATEKKDKSYALPLPTFKTLLHIDRGVIL